jgi:integrase
MHRGDWPKVIKQEVEVFTMEDLKNIFDASDPAEYVTYQTLLKTGFREKEGTDLTWPDVHWKRNVIAVTAKPQFNFRPKNSHERAVPVPTSLLDLLDDYRSKDKKSSSNLIFHTKVIGKHGANIHSHQLHAKLYPRLRITVGVAAYKDGYPKWRILGGFQLEFHSAETNDP